MSALRLALVSLSSLLLFVPSGAVIASELDGEPLLTNPSFEDDYTLSTIMYAYKGWQIENSKAPSQWAGQPNESHPKIEVITDQKAAHSGAKYIRVTAGTQPAQIFAEPSCPCAKGKVFLLSIWVRGSGKGAVSTIDYYDDGKNGGSAPKLFDLTQEWKQQFVVIKPSEPTRSMRLVFEARQDATMEVDDLTMVQATESTLPKSVIEGVSSTPASIEPRNRAVIGKSSRRIVDLIEMAPSARWESTAGDLVFGKDQYLVTLAEYRYNVKCCDKRTYAKTLYTPVTTLDYQTVVRGRFPVSLPIASKIALRGRVTAENSSLNRTAVGYILPEEPYKVNYLKDFEPAPLDGSPGVDFDLDLTFLSGKRVELVFRIKAVGNVRVANIHWTQAKVICEGVEGETARLPTQPVPRPIIKRITAFPRPWKAERLRVVFGNSLTSTAGYALTYDVVDFWGNRPATGRVVSLPRVHVAGVDVDLRPILSGKVGWWKVQFTLKNNGHVIDTQSISISKLPPRPTALNPILGILSAPQGFVTPGYSDVEIEMIKDLGARYVRSNGEGWLDFKKLGAQGNGEYCLTYIPHDFSGVSSEKGWTEEQEQKCYDATYKMVSARKGIVKIYELGNELNPYVPVENFARMQKTIYTAAKAADPDCIVNTVGAGGGGPAVVEWFRKFYELAGDSIDNISLHSYTFKEPDLDDYLMKRCEQPVESYIDILKSFGVYPRKNIYITEYGWIADSPQATKDQAKYTVRQFLLGCRYNIPMIQFLLTDMGYDFTSVCCEGLTYFNHEPKPSYVAFAVLARRLSGARFVEEKEIGKNKFLYVFEKNGRRFVYVWKAAGADEPIRLKASGASVEISDMMGGRRVIPTHGGMAILLLSTYPICVRGLSL